MSRILALRKLSVNVPVSNVNVPVSSRILGTGQLRQVREDRLA
jgi:hypothetical protein